MWESSLIEAVIRRVRDDRPRCVEGMQADVDVGQLVVTVQTAMGQLLPHKNGSADEFARVSDLCRPCGWRRNCGIVVFITPILKMLWLQRRPVQLLRLFLLLSGWPGAQITWSQC